MAILGGPDAPRMRAQHRPEWFANLGRLVLDVLRGAPEPMTARAIAVELMRLAGHDAGDRVAVEIVANRVRASLARRVGVVERVAVGAAPEGVAGGGLIAPATPARRVVPSPGAKGGWGMIASGQTFTGTRVILDGAHSRGAPSGAACWSTPAPCP